MQRRTPRFLLILAGAVAPAVLVLALLFLRFGAVPTDFIPWWDDEVIYWNEVAGFGRVGFDTGYVSVSGQTPPASFARFGPHGPAYTVIYGSIARVFGWQPYSAFIVNLLLITAAAAVWLAARGREVRWTEPAWIAAFWPLLLYLPTHMQESMHAAWALVLAAAAWRLRTTQRPLLIWAWAAPVLAIAALSRPTWGLALLALGWPAAKRRGRLGIAVLLASALIVTVGAQWLFSWLSTPYPNPQTEFLAEARASWQAAFALLARTISGNVQRFLSFSNGETPEIVFRYLVLVLVAVLAVAAWRARARRDGDAGIPIEAALLALAAPLPLVFAFGQIEAWRDFRLLAPHVLLALLLAGAVAPRIRWVWLATLVFVPQVYGTFIEFHDSRFRAPRTALEEARAAIPPVLSHVPGADPWRNTVLVDARSLEHPLIAIPPGISLSYVVDWDDEPMPPRAAYLWLKERDLEAVGRPLRLMPLAVTSSGTLYRNLDRAD